MNSKNVLSITNRKVPVIPKFLNPKNWKHCVWSESDYFIVKNFGHFKTRIYGECELGC